MSSEEVPLLLVPHNRLSINTLKTPPKFFLFMDAFVMVQVSEDIILYMSNECVSSMISGCIIIHEIVYDDRERVQ